MPIIFSVLCPQQGKGLPLLTCSPMEKVKGEPVGGVTWISAVIIPRCHQLPVPCAVAKQVSCFFSPLQSSLLFVCLFFCFSLFGCLF